MQKLKERVSLRNGIHKKRSQRRRRKVSKLTQKSLTKRKWPQRLYTNTLKKLLVIMRSNLSFKRQ